MASCSDTTPRTPGVVAAVAVLGRKMRVLSLLGDVSNSNVMKFQVSQLQKAVGSDAEWIFMDAPLPHENVKDAGHWAQSHNAERSAMETMLAKAMPFKQWARWTQDDEAATVTDAANQVAKFIGTHLRNPKHSQAPDPANLCVCVTPLFLRG